MERCGTKLLVHAGAPSSKRQDDGYIAQAEAYASALECHRGRIRIWEVREDRRLLTVEPGVGEATEALEDMTSIEDQVQTSSQVSQHYEQAELERSSTKRLRAPDSLEYIDDTQLACTALESQLFASSPVVAAHTGTSKDVHSVVSSVENRGSSSQQQARSSGKGCTQRSPLARKPARVSTSTTPPRRRAESAPVSQSSYIRTPLSGRASKRVRRESPERLDFEPANLFRPIQEQPLPRPDPSGQASTIALVHHSGDENSAEDTTFSDETTSELPTSYSVSDLVSDSQGNSLQDRVRNGRSSSDPGPVSHSLDDTFDPPSDLLQSEHRDVTVEEPFAEVRTLEPNPADAGSGDADQSDVGASPVHVQEQVPHDSTRANAYLDNDHKAPRPRHVDPSADVEEAPSELLELATEIHAPRPTTAAKTFKTYITKELRDLHDSLASKFSPTMALRPISTHERGHWLIDCVSWRPTKKLTFWHHLECWIGNGSAGWGVWCTRGSDEYLVPSNSLARPSNAADARGQFRFVRVYCWGETVSHIYVLLYTASEGSVRKLGLQWIDSKGDVVVRMKGPND